MSDAIKRLYAMAKLQRLDSMALLQKRGIYLHVKRQADKSFCVKGSDKIWIRVKGV